MQIEKTLQTLCALPAVSGFEEQAAQAVAALLRPLCDTVEVDHNGNVLGYKGCGRKHAKTVLLDAHLDQIGFVVTEVLDGGFLRFAPVGGVDPRMLLATEVTILADKPFAVGDWIQTSSVEGVVEDISLRSTRIRTFKDAVIVVPNSSISSSEIINWSRMNKRKVEMTLGLTYQTSRETLQAVLGGIRKLLQEEETVSTPPVVTFAGFGASSLDITVNYFIDRTTLAEYNEVKEAINFKIMELCEKLGAEFAYPTQTLFVEQSEIKPAE